MSPRRAAPGQQPVENREGVEEKRCEQGAAEAYKKALEVYPYFFEARINLGTVYYKQGLLKDAFREYQKALDLDPESPEAYYNIGNVSAAIGKTKEAKEFWQEALKKNPNHAGAKKKLEKTNKQR